MAKKASAHTSDDAASTRTEPVLGSPKIQRMIAMIANGWREQSQVMERNGRLPNANIIHTVKFQRHDLVAAV